MTMTMMYDDDDDDDDDDDNGDPDDTPDDSKLWIGWGSMATGSAIVRRLDGMTGETEFEVTIDDWVGEWGHGIYGGAVDGDRNFWGLGTWGTMIRIDAVTQEVTRWDSTAGNTVIYGIAMDADGKPWFGGWLGDIWHFDPGTGQFENKGETAGSWVHRGLAIDPEGHAWIAGNDPCGLLRYDTVAGELIDNAIELPGCLRPVGVSIDADSAVWVVDQEANRAYKVDPTDYSVETVEGLVMPYTYSDMTGMGLKLVQSESG